MIARGKRRFAAVVLVVFTAWPLVHFGLVRAYGLDAWKFGGWAMYTEVGFIPQVEVFAVREGERTQLGLGSLDFPASRAAQEQLVFAVKYYGELANPDALARAATAELGDDPAIEIVVTRYFLDPNSDRVSAKRQSFFYESAIRL